MTKPKNPWGISPAEAAAMDALAEHYCVKRAADALRLSPKTVNLHVSHVGRKMGIAAGDRLGKHLIWARWRWNTQKQERTQK